MTAVTWIGLLDVVQMFVSREGKCSVKNIWIRPQEALKAATTAFCGAIGTVLYHLRASPEQLGYSYQVGFQQH
ncbi:hypothetical protein DPMN_175634 [Dreissena polymorpha]|uniref:Uncharacterized protein n=1 Tax=Dreissena polymorpha TaxID=45954 RepID=A0A9D4IJT8_DREPO|nr:hypothetical protein DPMN_175634 [Dreissena polymorpha]